MARDLTNTVLSEIFAQETDKVFLVLLKLDHSSLSEPFYLVNDKKDLTSSVLGTPVLYQRFSFTITLPEDTESNSLSSSKLVVDNVNRLLIKAIRSISSYPEITFVVVLENDPNTAVIGPITLNLYNIRYNSFEITGDLSMENLFNESFPKDTYSPANVPGLF